MAFSFCFRFMIEFTLSIVNKFGYFGVFILVAVENIFPPIPSEVILLFSGFITTYTNLSILGMILSSTIGSLFGAVFLYYIGKMLKKEKLRKIFFRKVSLDNFKKSCEWFNKRGSFTVLFCRLIPLIRSLISIPAGMSGMPIFRFLIFTFIGVLLWNVIIIYIGVILSNNWSSILNIFNAYSYLVILVMVVFIICIFLKRILKKKHSI